MVDISKNQILTFSRGDTVIVPIYINAGTKICPDKYDLKDTDKLYFGLTETGKPFECAIVKKVLTKEDIDDEGNLILRLESSDSEYLLPGKYYYEIILEHTLEDDSQFIQNLTNKRICYIL